MKQFQKYLLVGIVFLMSFIAFSAPASSAGIVENYPQEVLVGQDVVLKFQPDPGVTYDLRWDTDYNGQGAPVEKVRTTCSGDANQPGCQVTVRFNEPRSLARVEVWYSPDMMQGDSAWFKVRNPEDMPAPIIVNGPKTLTLPRDTLEVLTPKERLIAGWTSPDFAAAAEIRRAGTKDGLNRFILTLHAPRGWIRLFLLAIGSGGGEDRLFRTIQVRRYSGPMYGQFKLTLKQYHGDMIAGGRNRDRTPRPQYLAAPKLRFRAIKPARWELTTRIQRRSGGRWQDVAKRRDRGRSVTGRARYDQNPYGKGLRLTGAKLTQARAASCNGTPYRIVMRARITTLGGKGIKSLSRVSSLQPFTC